MPRRDRGVILRRDNFGEDAVLITHKPGDFDANNSFIPGAQTRAPVRVAAYPDTLTQARMVLPEGGRLEQTMMFYMQGPVAVGPTEGTGDIVEYRGVMYRVKDVTDYGQGMVSVYAVREQQ